MYCRWCGGEVQEDALYCLHCGRALQDGREAVYREPSETSVQGTGSAEWQTYCGPDDREVAPDRYVPLLTSILCLLCFAGISSFFFTHMRVETFSDVYGWEYFYYDPIYMLTGADFASDGFYPDFPAKFCPLLIAILFGIMMLFSLGCVEHRPSKAIPLIGAVIFVLGLFESMSIMDQSFTWTYYGVTYTDYAYTDMGLHVAAWSCILVFIVGFILDRRMEAAGWPPSRFRRGRKSRSGRMKKEQNGSEGSI